MTNRTTKLALIALAMLASATAARTGEDLDRLDIEASYCKNVAFKSWHVWQAKPEGAMTRQENITKFKRSYFRIMLYLSARGVGHENSQAVQSGLFDYKTCMDGLNAEMGRCESACSKCASVFDVCYTPQFIECSNSLCTFNALNAIACKKIANCGTLDERLPM
jgi:hypothetical protein